MLILCLSYFITTVATTFNMWWHPAVKTVSRNTYVSLCTQKFNWETDRWAEWEAFVLSFIDLLVKLDRDSNRMNILLIWTGKMVWLSSQFCKLLARNSETWLQWHLEQSQQFYHLLEDGVHVHELSILVFYWKKKLQVAIKYIFSEKATKIWRNLQILFEIT